MIDSDLFITVSELEAMPEDLKKNYLLKELNVRLSEGFIYSSDFNNPRLAYGVKFEEELLVRPFFVNLSSLKQVFDSKGDWKVVNKYNKARIKRNCLELKRITPKYDKSSVRFEEEETKLLESLVISCCNIEQ
ncbi:MAG: hypothetical protein JW791_02155 [Nanoarchaeota archaeon]|nr:hypothetical protein [Nanoarchaeota archaeon]